MVAEIQRRVIGAAPTCRAMRTRIGDPGGHGSAPTARCTATADASAADGSANTARNASPTLLKT